MVKYWLHVSRRENWDIDKKNNDFKIGLVDRWKNKLREISVGDRVVFYLTGGKIAGIFEAISEYFHEETKIWKGGIYPHRLNLKRILIAEEPSQEVDIRKLVETLSFVEYKEKWGLYLRAAIREIPKEDFELMRSELMRQRRGIGAKREKVKEFSEDYYKNRIMKLEELQSTSLHERICEMLEWIGTWSGYSVSRRHKIVKGSPYEIDVAWLQGKNPHIAIEVQIGGNPTEAKDRLAQAKKFNFRKLVMASELKWKNRLEALLRFDELRHWIDIWSIRAVYEMYQSGKRFYELYNRLEESRYKEFGKLEFI